MSGINTLYTRTLPTRPPLELRGLPELALQPGQRRTAPPDVAAGDATGENIASSAGSSGGSSTLIVKERLKRALRAVRESHELAAQQQSSSSAAQTYWTTDKALLWGGILALG